MTRLPACLAACGGGPSSLVPRSSVQSAPRPALFAELLARGWTEPDCAALASANLLRILREAESAAA